MKTNLKLSIIQFVEESLSPANYTSADALTAGIKSTPLLSHCARWHDSLLPAETPAVSHEKDGVCHQVALLHGALAASFPDLRYTVTEVAETNAGEHVAVVYWRGTGSHAHGSAPFCGCPPPGPDATPVVVHLAGTLTLKLAGQQQGDQEQQQPHKRQRLLVHQQQGQTQGEKEKDVVVVEAWWNWDPLLLLRQLGVQVVADPQSTPTTLTVPFPLKPYDGSLPAAVQKLIAVDMNTADNCQQALPSVPQSSQYLSIQDVAATYFHVYNTGRFELLKYIVHPDYRYEGLLDLGSLRGEAAMRAMMSGWRDALLDLRIGYEWVGYETFTPAAPAALLGTRSDVTASPTSSSRAAAAAAVGAGPGDGRIFFRWVLQGTHTGSSWCSVVTARGGQVVCRGVTCLVLYQGHIARKISHASGLDALRLLGGKLSLPAEEGVQQHVPAVVGLPEELQPLQVSDA